MARLVSRSGRSRLTGLLILVLLASSVIALAAFYLFPRPTSPRPPAAASSSAAPSTSASRDDTAETAPTGCLGGQQRDPDMVLAAQRQAPHTAYGAVEVAAAVFRWGLRYPYPSQDEVRAVRPVLAPATASKQEADLARSYRGPYQPPTSQKLPDGTPYYVTTANGSWLIGTGSTTERVSVQVETHPVVDDAYSTSTVILQFDLRWIDGSWYLHNLARADAQALANGGTTFTSGC